MVYRIMKKKTAKQRILDHLSIHSWVSGKSLEEKAIEWGYKPSYISREARRLEETDENVHKRYTKNGYVEYSVIGFPKQEIKRIQIITKPDGTQVAQYV